MRAGIVVIISLLGISSSFAAPTCQQPMSVINIGNLACVDPETGKTVHSAYRGNYKHNIFSDDSHDEWYRGNFYGMDDD